MEYIVITLLLAPSLIITSIEWLAFRKHEHSFVLLSAVWVIQGIIFFSLLESIVNDMKGSPYGVAGLIALYLVGYTTIIGAATYPVLALIVHRPKAWKEGTSTLLMLYAAIVFLLFIEPRLYIEHKARTNPNTHFFGEVTDIDGKPTSDARVSISNCHGEKEYVTNKNGRFEILAECPSILGIKTIYNTQTNSYCLSSWQTQSNILELASIPETSNQFLNGYNEYTNKNPFQFTCVWCKPKNYRHTRGVTKTWDVAPDGRLYTLNLTNEKPGVGAYPKITEGKNEGQLLISIFLEKIKTTNSTEWHKRSGWVLIEAQNGGVQSTQDLIVNMAPINGYSDKYYREFEDISELWEKLYFHSNSKNEFGYISISSNLMSRVGDKKLRMNANYRLNMDGERALIDIRQR